MKVYMTLKDIVDGDIDVLRGLVLPSYSRVKMLREDKEKNILTVKYGENTFYVRKDDLMEVEPTLEEEEIDRHQKEMDLMDMYHTTAVLYPGNRNIIEFT